MTNDTRKIIGWKPKGEKQAVRLAKMFNHNDAMGEFVPGSFVEKELRELGILEALCEPVYEEAEIEKEWVFTKDSHSYILDNGKDHFVILNINTEEEVEQICYLLNRAKRADDLSQALRFKYTELEEAKDKIKELEAKLNAVEAPAGPTVSGQKILDALSRIKPEPVRRLSIEMLINIAEEIWRNKTGYFIAFVDLIEMGKRVWDFYEKKDVDGYNDQVKEYQK